MANAFVDSNILIYAASDIDLEKRKSAIAREILHQNELHISVQVLNEFTANARNIKKLNLSRERENSWIESFLLLRIIPLSVETYLAAVTIHKRYQLSHWDSLIIAAAQEANCEIIYSEDLSHGQTYGCVKVVNPFLVKSKK